MVYDELEGLLSGESTVEEVAQALSQKVERYLQE
jgi:hypothetical protein